MAEQDGSGRVGRPEVPVDPDAGPVAAFASDLRALRQAAGNPTYAALARRTGVSSSALSEAARGRRPPSWPTVAAFVRGCGGDPDQWRTRWTTMKGTPDVEPATPPADVSVSTSETRGRRHARRVLAIVAGCATVAVIAAVLVYVWRPFAATASAAKHPTTPAAASHQPATTPAGRWRQVMGPGCGPNRTGAQVDVDKGWTPSGGGWTADGCNGKAVTAALSNSPTDWDRTVGWAFEPGFPADCRIDVYVPDSPDAAGSAIYQIYGRDATGAVPATAISPPIPQAVYHGRWITIGTYHFPDGVVTIELGNLGVGTQHITADAARVTCS